MACKMVLVHTYNITSCFAHVLMNPVPVLWLHLALVLVLLHHLHSVADLGMGLWGGGGWLEGRPGAWPTHSPARGYGGAL